MAEKEKKRTCVRCLYDHSEDDQYCIRCGAPLVNRCTDESGLLSKGCSKVNSPEAAYCSRCGQPTVFHRAGLVKGYFD